jgi:DNA polymerase-3 subunit gamma/tau
MLSKAAFNGLLKTLEEPPEHVKFIFATTEIEKVPVTVRSRCLRFDLKRIETNMLTRHLEKICAAEGVVAEPEALALIARLSEGSVRDSLSLLDQAIAHDGASAVKAEGVRAMLGLADQGAIVDLFEKTMRGDIAAAMAAMTALYQAGADPAQSLLELAEFTHFVTRIKIAGAVDDPAISEDERKRGAILAQGLAMGPLTRAWQILLKGLQEIKDSPRPLASAEMVLIRLAYAADLPSPEDALRKLAETGEAPALPPGPPPSRGPSGGASAALRIETRATPIAVAPAPARGPVLASFEEVVALAKSKRDIQLQAALESDVRLQRFEAGSIAFSLVDGASPQIAQTLARRLQEWTGERWMVALAPGSEAPTMRERAEAKEKERLSGVAAHPLIQKVLQRFPGAEIVDVRGPEAQAETPASATPPADDDIGYGDTAIGEDDF